MIVADHHEYDSVMLEFVSCLDKTNELPTSKIMFVMYGPTFGGIQIRSVAPVLSADMTLCNIPE
jgi:hypothetical protein